MAQLAQINIARMRFAPDDPAMDDFVRALDPVNASAEANPGFVWRLVSDENGSSALADFEADGWLVNMSVWDSLDDLRSFLKSPLHLAVMRRRAEWFEPTEHHLCLWWVEDGHRPTFEEARARLATLAESGPGPRAFTFAEPFPPP